MSDARRGLIAWIEGIGIRGPGLAGWPATSTALAGGGHVDAPTVLVAPSALPAAERRRVGKGVKVALEVGFEAVAAAGLDAASLPSVFTSSSGDGDNCDAICRALVDDDRLISPTRFHNSVHNAPSGYWGIASGSMASSTSLCAFDDSFVAGLDDAMTQLATGADAILLVAYDAPYPEPLHGARPTPDSFGVALVLSRSARPAALASIELLRSDGATPATMLDDPLLERYRTSIPAARALPLLAAIASRADDAVVVIDGARGTGTRLRVRTASTIHPSLPLASCA